MIRGSWSIKELLSWAVWNSIEERVNQIQNPVAWRWMDDLEDFYDVFARLDSFCRSRTFLKVKTACFLSSLIFKYPRAYDIAKFIYETTSYFQKEFELLFDELWSMEWVVAPWVGVIEDRQMVNNAGIIGYVVTGASNKCETPEAIIMPNIGASFIDVEAERAFRDTIEEITGRFKCRRLIVLLFPEMPVYGGSFSLSVYASVWSALSGKKIPEGVIFSGRIGKHGNVLPTGNLKKKARISEMNGFKAIICGSKRGFGVENSGRIECVSIGTLDEFDFLMDIYLPGYGREVHKFHEVLGTPESFATRFYQLDEKMMRSHFFDKACDENIPLILEDPVRAEEFSNSLERAGERFGSEPELLKKILAPVKENSVEKLVLLRPSAAWTIAFYRSTLAAREGELEEAKKWEKLVEIATDRIIQTVGIIERKADLYNRNVVTSYHLAFYFSPELPGTFLGVMQTLERFTKELSLHVTPTLGKMYGTAAQHYGFCGPSYLSIVEDYVKKAKKAFGNGTIPELYNDFNRQWNYLVYAYLDANRYDDAEEALRAYLGIRDLSRTNVFDAKCWNDFHHAALARFVADTGKYVEVFSNLRSEHLSRIIKNRHPWQLWAFNVGRIMENRHLKLELWKTSYRIATGLKGSAFAFALLPLSAMFMEKLELDEKIALDVEKIKNHLRFCKGLNQKHFEALWAEGDLKNILEKVWNERHIFFPFTYR